MTAKISGNALKQGSRTHSVLRQRGSELQKYKAALMSRPVPSPRGDLAPTNKAPSPPKLKHETLLSVEICQFLECQVPRTKPKPPTENFLATVLVYNIYFFFISLRRAAGRSLNVLFVASCRANQFKTNS